MIATLEAGLEALPQQGAERLQAAHAECDAQERMANKRGPLALGMHVHNEVSQNGHATPPASYAVEPANTMQGKQSISDQLSQLSQLKQSGVLTQEQFDQAVAKVIAAG